MENTIIRKARTYLRQLLCLHKYDVSLSIRKGLFPGHLIPVEREEMTVFCPKCKKVFLRRSKPFGPYV
jgi:hypothetical protein